ncbi:hypothetical protein G3A_14220 [Bacillus sp. 17376]|nr:hypothetical protein G3A_14220 [Bacillus sp. 17376]
MSYTYSNFKEDLRRRAFEEKNRFYKRVLEVVEDYINPEAITGFYPKNVFNNNEHKEFIFLLENKIVIVHFEREKTYYIRSFDSTVKESSLTIPEFTQEGVLLSLQFENGELIIFNSLDDSNRSWNGTYIELIQAFFKKLN